jgi:integrase
VTFLACLRKEEANALRWEDITDGVVPGSVHIFVRKSKTDQHSVGRTLPVAGRTAGGLDLGEAISRLRIAQLARGGIATGPLFQDMQHAGRGLKTAASMIQRLETEYFPALERNGVVLLHDFKLSGHSFRRGGITAIRDAARASRMSTADLRQLLLVFGRWRDPRSLDIYLVEDWEELTRLTARV